jgi:Flp pilus assembly CpaF family ATPase
VDKNRSNGSADLPQDDDPSMPPPAQSGKARRVELVPGHMGTRLYSMAALLERIILSFDNEHGEESTAYREADTPAKKLKLIRDTVEYVLAVESVQLSPDQKAGLIQRAYSERFGYGPLDPLFEDATITTIALEGAEKISVRHGHGELVSLPPVFEDNHHLYRVIRRLLKDAGAQLGDDQPYVEVGLTVNNRPICLSLIAPPITIYLTADIRLHPVQRPTLDGLVESGFLTPESATFLRALIASPHGFVVVGDTESGKTTLLSVLAQLLPHPEATIAVERAGELSLPDGVQRLTASWPVDDRPGITFGEQIGVALEQSPGCIILDEIRADEPETIAPLLELPDAPRQIWSFRGPSDSKRLNSALGMVARRANTAQSETMVQALYRRLPFMISVKRGRDGIQLRGIAEWQFPEGAEYPDFVELITTGWEGLEFTGKRPSHDLDLPGDFWR